MADGFIVRKGGVTTEQALAPTITEVSTTDSSITFTITNNDASTAIILYELDDATPDANSIELAAAATSGSITVSDLADDTAFDVYATANVTGKVKSNVTELEITTDVPIIFTAATGGTTAEYDDGGTRYKSHTFTSDGTFTVTTVGDAADDRNKVDYLIIAGGGAGGPAFEGGGGGAGGYLTTLGATSGDVTANAKVVVTAQGYSIVVGAGGVRGTVELATPGNSGTNSSALGITSIGGGGAGTYNARPASGGSGGGAGGTAVQVDNGAAGTSGQGFAGGNAVSGFGASAAGGGGASEVGKNPTSSTTGGNGGNGLANLLRTGSNETRAGGGGGGGNTGGAGGTGGTGGGGNGSFETSNVVVGSGTVNTGSGGGGSRNNTVTSGGNGGSGIVVIRYEIAPSV